MPILGPFDFRGGYSPGYDFLTLPQEPHYANLMENCRMRNGYVTFRYGFNRISAATGFTTNKLMDSVKSWYDTVNSKMALVATTNSQLMIGDATAATPSTTGVVFTNRIGALAAASVSSLYTNYDSLNNILVGSANSASSGAVFKVTAYNANAAVLGGSPPSADIVKQCNNFMFLARNLSSTTTQSKVYWSNVNDPETWTAANVLDFKKNDGEPIMALGSIGTDLYIFKQNSIGRLSTVTITTSGAITLGPLVTVVQGVGCCGPRALDNLPNGNIVFVSFDGHFYEFDGSTLIDRSKMPYPGANAYANGQLSTSTFSNFGLSGCLPDTTVNVKVCRGINEVWISFYQPLDNSSAGNVFMYDFERNIWQGTFSQNGTSTVAVNCMTTLPMTTFQNPTESSEFFVIGQTSNSDPALFTNGIFTKPYSTSASSVSITSVNLQIGTTIQLPMTENGPFIPRSICLETSHTQSSGSTLTTFTVQYAFDQYIGNSTTAYTGTASTVLPTRIVMPLTFKQDSTGTNIFPSFLSILITAKGQGSSVANNEDILRIGKFWLSDEIIR